MNQAQAIETKRGRGRPSTFPADVETKAAGYKLPVTTLTLVDEVAERMEINKNGLVDRALRAYLTRKTRTKN